MSGPGNSRLATTLPLPERNPLPRGETAIAALVMLTAAAIVLATGLSFLWLRRFLIVIPPAVATVDIPAVLTDVTPIAVPVRATGQRGSLSTTVFEVRNSVPLWRDMHLADWNAVPQLLRETALDRMLAHYGPMLMSPAAWDRMTPRGWDQVPQPIRTITYRQMMAYWSGYYGVGRAYGLSPRLVSDTLCAIVMSESWFEHRATLVNTDGSMDIGLGGASEFARTRLRQLQPRGVVDVAPDDAAYFNPWVATRFVAVWMTLLLDEANGDLDLAIRAYNRGISAARDDAGTTYLETVRQRRRRFIRNQESPPAWDYVWRRAQALEEREWPWMADQVGSGETRSTLPSQANVADGHAPWFRGAGP
ncbi:MAG: transglycosylase SLT domain-containing protein [Vicinamibacterales bacterium]